MAEPSSARLNSRLQSEMQIQDSTFCLPPLLRGRWGSHIAMARNGFIKQVALFLARAGCVLYRFSRGGTGVPPCDPAGGSAIMGKMPMPLPPLRSPRSLQ